jgi:aspartate racemase
MEQPFFRERIERDYGVRCLLPAPERRRELHRIIFEELCAGRFDVAARDYLHACIGEGAQAGAQGVILGCTELGLLLGDAAVGMPVFDTAALHAAAAVDFALA